jgi:hypothetical protein
MIYTVFCFDFLQDTETRYKRVFMWGRNIDHDLSASLKSFNGSANRVVFITHIEAGFNNEANTGKVFLALAEPVSINKIKSRFEALGAFEVNWRAFPSNDNNEAASSALCSVRQLAAKSKDGGYANGTCDEHLNQRTQEKLDAIKLQQKQHDAAELHEKVAADAKLQHQELRGDVAQCATVAVANGTKIDAIGTSIKESTETIANAVAANGNALEEIYDQVGENAGWLMRKNDGLEERYTEAVVELAGKKAEMDTAKISAAGKHGDKMRRLRKEMDEMKKSYGAAVSEISKLKLDKDADAKTIAHMAQRLEDSEEVKDGLRREVKSEKQSTADLRYLLGIHNCVEKLHEITVRKRGRSPSDSD